eukprot:scaffold10697_cov151-Amphora_coffeaeformis.AAC.6
MNVVSRPKFGMVLFLSLLVGWLETCSPLTTDGLITFEKSRLRNQIGTGNPSRAARRPNTREDEKKIAHAVSVLLVHSLLCDDPRATTAYS